MFSGLIQGMGTVWTNTGPRIAVVAPAALRLKEGASVAVNGVCLTVVRSQRRAGGVLHNFDVSSETLAKTTLGRLKAGTRVNLEPALTLKDSLGGHIVQGHVDGVGRVAAVERQGPDKTIWFSAPRTLQRYLVSKGSVAIDGVSLTVARIRGDRFSVALIPFTLAHTNLDALRSGDAVNLEADIIAKYVEKYTRGRRR